MKTERVTLLATPEFKAFLVAEAAREGLTVSALVRNRCERVPTAEEAEVSALATELRTAVRSAKRSLREGLDEARQALADMRAARLEQSPAGAAEDAATPAPKARRPRRSVGKQARAA